MDPDFKVSTQLHSPRVSSLTRASSMPAGLRRQSVVTGRNSLPTKASRIESCSSGERYDGCCDAAAGCLSLAAFPLEMDPPRRYWAAPLHP